MPSVAIGIFSKTPNSQEAKTRLRSAGLSDTAVQKLHTQLVTRTFQVLKELQDTQCFVYWLPAVDSLFSLESVQTSISFCEHALQQGDSFSERFSNMIQSLKNKEYSSLIAVGTDCPFLEPEDYRQAITVLNSGNAVYGPAQRGGLYLLGLPARSSDIDWCSLFNESNQQDKFLKLFPGAIKLRELHDIDVKEDLPLLEKSMLELSMVI